MRKTLLALALTLGTLAAEADGGNYLTLRRQDGTETSLSLASKLKLTFADGRVAIESAGFVSDFALDALADMRFDEQPTGIAAAPSAASSSVVCYDLAGRRVAQPAGGLYIVKEGNVSRKILKR